MLRTAETLKAFFGGFSIPAYKENSVPDDVKLPYITFPLIEPEWDESASYYCQVWYKRKQVEALLMKADEIVGAIGEGIVFDQDGGYVALYPSSPLIQTLTDEDTDRAYLNLLIRAYHTPGD